MEDYAEIEKGLDEIINEGESYFNTLNFQRDALAFGEDEKGENERYGKKGYFAIPDLPALSGGEIERESFDGEWITLGDTIETPFYNIKFNPDGSISSLYDKELLREWADGDFNKLKIYTDNPGNYDAWDILPNYKDKQIEIKVEKALVLKHKDSECATFEAVLKTEKSTWTMLIRLFRQS